MMHQRFEEGLWVKLITDVFFVIYVLENVAIALHYYM